MAIACFFEKTTQQMQQQHTYLRWGLWGLIISGFSSLIIFFSKPTEPPVPADLFKQFFVPHENDVVKIADGFAAQGLREQAFRLYDQKRYHQALILFDELSRGQSDAEIGFFKGNILLALGQYQNAYSNFQQIPTGDKRYAAARWYSALASLMLGEGPPLDHQLKEIIAQDTLYKEPAQHLLKLLK